MKTLFLAASWAIAAPLHAAPWSFGEPVTVTGGESGHFHHLDGASRQHLAVDGETVVLTWEDDRDGSPQIYLAAKAREAAAFDRETKLSTGDEAYEPAVISLGGNDWLAAWEQDGAIWAGAVNRFRPGPPVRLSAPGARQVTLARYGESALVAVWARDRDGGQMLEVADLIVDNGVVSVGELSVIALPGAHPFQGYPAAVFTADGHLVLAWEDRRAGHTRLFTTTREPGAAFAQERKLNEHREPSTGDDQGSARLGSGVMRVTLAARRSVVYAAWLDKRDPGSGYAVWGARSDDGGGSFGANVKIQDPLGDAVQQWHPSIAARTEGFVVVWDDPRARWLDETESGDVFLSWSTADGWSEDLAVPGASGAGYQGSPAIAIDVDDDLHLAWIERDDLSAPTRLRYLRAAAGDQSAAGPGELPDQSGNMVSTRDITANINDHGARGIFQ